MHHIGAQLKFSDFFQKKSSTLGKAEHIKTKNCGESGQDEHEMHEH